MALYLEGLLDSGILDAADVLSALSRRSAVRADEEGLQYEPQLESNVLLQLTRKFVSNSRPRTKHEAVSTFRALCGFTAAIIARFAHDSAIDSTSDLLAQQQHQEEQLTIAPIRDALGQLLIAVLENPRMAGIIDFGLDQSARKALAQTVTGFNTSWSQLWPTLGERLLTAQRHHDIFDDGNRLTAGESELSMAVTALEATPDLPAVRTRAHLYVLVSSMSSGLPLTDDTTIISYLNFVYNGNMSNMATDIILASFDALSAAHTRQEPEHMRVCLRSFLINKIPLILTIIQASAYQGLSLEYCITESLAHIDPTAFPSLSDSFMASASALSDVRQDFVFSCTRHGLLPAASVERLLGETPLTTPPTLADKYHKDNIIAQCTAHSEKLEFYLTELEKIDGNAGAIAQAVTELSRTSCASKETMLLKNLSNALSRRPVSMDIMLQFTSARSLLQPLCDLLDGWRYDEDQGECQPVYDEFAAILLLVVALIHRYNLDPSDLGIEPSSFIAELLSKGYQSKSLDELTHDERRHLEAWISGLFNPEGEGISDEVMSGCRPQDFYLLMPTLVNQVVTACSAGVMDMSTAKSGFDCRSQRMESLPNHADCFPDLLLPFLLPAVIGAIGWMCENAWEQGSNNTMTVVQLLQKLVVRPSGSTSSSANDTTSAMHNTVMGIVCPQVEKHLLIIERRDAKLRSVADNLRKAMKPHQGFYAARVSASSGGSTILGTSLAADIHQQVRSFVRELSVWSLNASMSVPGMPMIQSPPLTYSPVAMQVAQTLLGAPGTAKAIAEEVKTQTEQGNGAVAIEVATALVCAPHSHDSTIPITWMASAAPMQVTVRTALNLREALKLAVDEAPSLWKGNEPLAQATIRIHRRVEGLCMGVSVTGDGGLGAAAVAAAAAATAVVTIAPTVPDGHVGDLAMEVAAAEHMPLDETMALDVASGADPIPELLDPLQTQVLYGSAGDMSAANINLSTSGLASVTGNNAGDELDLGLMGDGEDDMFAGLDLGEDLGF